MSNLDEAVEFSGARSRMYRFLATCFQAPPPPDRPLPFSDPLQRAAIASLFPDPGLIEALRAWNVVVPDHKSVSDEFHTLFVVPGPRYLPPFASVFLDTSSAPDRSRSRGLLNGPSTLAVRDFYARAGFVLEDGMELPDHITLELQFMAALCEEESRALAASDTDTAERWADLQARFLSGHLNPFIVALCAAIDVASRCAFFRTTSALLRAAVSCDPHNLPSPSEPS